MVLSRYIYTYAVILLTVFSCSVQEDAHFQDLRNYTQINSSDINYLDNVLYKKTGNKYYKRNYNGVIYLKWYHDKFNGDGDRMIQEAVKMASPNDVIVIEGELRLKKTLIIDKAITLAGNSFVNSNDTHSANNSRIYFSVPLNVGIQAKSINLMNLTIAGNDLSNKVGVNAVGSVVLLNVTIQMFDTGLMVTEGYYNKFQNSFITYCTTNLILDKCYNSNAFGVSFSTTPNSAKYSTNIILKNKTNLNLFGCSVESFNITVLI